MAAAKKKPAKGAKTKKTGRGRMPVKRSINLILIDEKKVNPVKAILGIIVVVALAGVFGKYMVVDRLNAMSEAASRASQAKNRVAEVQASLEGFGDIEEAYAHYTYNGMTDAEKNLIDRNKILDLAAKVLPGGDTPLSPQEFINRVIALVTEYMSGEDETMTQEEFGSQLGQLVKRIIPSGYRVRSWNVSGTNLNLSITGTSLQRLNRLARQLEKLPIVNYCAIINASRSRQIQSDEAVSANLIIYLQPPVEEEPTEAPVEEEAAQ